MSKHYDIEGIFGARVPILKFTEKQSDMEIDISVYNTIGVANSKMTRLYCEFDQRAHILIKYVRYVLKGAGLLVSDQGCLSSYAIILMVVAFLQAQDSPILPNLFSDKYDKTPLTFYNVSSNKFKRVSVDAIQAQFTENLADVRKQFESSNEKSVGELVLEFFQFYFLRPEGYQMKQIDITHDGGFSEEVPDSKPLFDIVEPLFKSNRVGVGCHKDSHHTESYRKFAYEFCANVINSAN